MKTRHGVEMTFTQEGNRIAINYVGGLGADRIGFHTQEDYENKKYCFVDLAGEFIGEGYNVSRLDKSLKGIVDYITNEDGEYIIYTK
jgi:hypothetical protein